MFCNNEDWNDPVTTIWFVPATAAGRYGCAYVGFGDGLPMGGVNTEGLAFDWVWGSNEPWTPDTTLPVSFGCRDMLDTCASVKEAIAFLRARRELGFYIARMLVADRTGASAIIGGKGNELHLQISHRSRGFGLGEGKIDLPKALRSAQPILQDGERILRACVHEKRLGYSNIFDLKTGALFLYPSRDRQTRVELDLAAELQKGIHYYDMPQIQQQLTRSPQPLLPQMVPMRLENCRAIADSEPQVTASVRRMWQDRLHNTMHADDYTSAARELEYLTRTMDGPIFKSFEQLVSLTLVGRSVENGKRSYWYSLQFEKGTILQQFAFDNQNKLASSRIEDIR